MPISVRCLSCLLLLAAATSVQAACPIDRPIGAGSYESGITFDAKTQSGFDADLLKALSERTGCRFDPVFDSRVRLWARLTQGELDMMTSVLDLPDREQYARFVIHSYARTAVLAHTQPDFPTSPEAFLAHKRLTITSVKTYRFSPGIDEWVMQLRAQGRIYEAPDTLTMLKVFDAGRVAAMAIPPEALAAVGHRYVLAQPYQRLHWFDRYPKAGGGLALSKATLPPAVADRFQQEIDRMRADGTLLRMAGKYFDRDAAADFVRPD